MFGEKAICSFRRPVRSHSFILYVGRQYPNFEHMYDGVNKSVIPASMHRRLDACLHDTLLYNDGSYLYIT